MSVDALGTNCDQCWSTVQYCFTSSLGRKAQDGQLDFHTVPELWTLSKIIPLINFSPTLSWLLCTRRSKFEVSWPWAEKGNVMKRTVSLWIVYVPSYAPRTRLGFYSHRSSVSRVQNNEYGLRTSKCFAASIAEFVSRNIPGPYNLEVLFFLHV